MNGKKLRYWLNQLQNRIAADSADVRQQAAMMRELSDMLAVEAGELEVRRTPNERAPMCAVCGHRHWMRDSHVGMVQSA